LPDEGVKTPVCAPRDWSTADIGYHGVFWQPRATKGPGGKVAGEEKIPSGTRP